MDQVRYLQMNVSGIRRRAHAFNDCLDHRHEFDRAHIEPELAGNDARDVEQIVNELRLGPGTANDGLNCTF